MGKRASRKMIPPTRVIPDPDLDHGPVYVTRSVHKGRIGYYDGDCGDGKRGVVFFGDMLYVIAHDVGGYYLINEEYLVLPTTNQLLMRRQIIESKRRRIRKIIKGIESECAGDEAEMLCELHALKDSDAELEAEDRFVMTTLYTRMLTRGLAKPPLGNKKIFISHSSRDKPFVRRVVDDLKIRGHCLWFDETAIKAGDSIPREIQKGLQESSYVIVFLSKHAVTSSWVEVEWMGKFWEEINSKKRVVIPVLLEHCEIPFFLRTKKHINFSECYETALGDIIKAIT